MTATERARLRELAETAVEDANVKLMSNLIREEFLPLLDQLERMEKALRELLTWLEDDTLEIMKDTRTMGITFDSSDCARLREQIEKAEAALGGKERE